MAGAEPNPTKNAPRPASTRGASITTHEDTHRITPLAYSPTEAAAALGIGRRTIDALLADDAIPHARIGARVLIPVAELRAWLSARTCGGGEGGAA